MSPRTQCTKQERCNPIFMGGAYKTREIYQRMTVQYGCISVSEPEKYLYKDSHRRV